MALAALDHAWLVSVTRISVVGSTFLMQVLHRNISVSKLLRQFDAYPRDQDHRDSQSSSLQAVPNLSSKLILEMAGLYSDPETKATMLDAVASWPSVWETEKLRSLQGWLARSVHHASLDLKLAQESQALRLGRAVRAVCVSLV